MVERAHQVAAYADPAALAQRVASFAAASLAEGIPVATICRSPLRRDVLRLLAGQGVDVDRASRDGAFVAVDAEEALSTFMVAGRPDPRRFTALIASLLPADGGPVSAFGEMVSVLWERGEVVAALELESLWNAALDAHPIRLLCAYPGDLLAGARLEDVSRMCDLHDHVSLVGGHPHAGSTPIGGLGTVSSVYLPVPQAVASVRGFVRDTLMAWGLDDLVGDAVLVTSELATNAVTHGNSPFRTSLLQVADTVRVAVEDGADSWPERHHARAGDQEGRGMAIVAALSRRSGCSSTPVGKVAWAELAL